MPGYLLDTNIVSDLVHQPVGGKVAMYVVLLREEDNPIIATSIIVAAELRYGAVKRGSTRLTQNIESVLGGLDVLPFEAPADVFYGELRADLERRGQLIGRHDMLIAAHALALGYSLVTANVREFGRIDGLPVENWLKDD